MDRRVVFDHLTHEVEDPLLRRPRECPGLGDDGVGQIMFPIVQKAVEQVSEASEVPVETAAGHPHSLGDDDDLDAVDAALLENKQCAAHPVLAPQLFLFPYAHR